ncbi:MAG: stage 0 sporulation family protein [Bacilli bacterium]|nr:stage 0 sporulation family protein [Bacilli bacterium]MDD4809087.1 stage 0 sporulation family protein [Bacilli bacterium]
MIEVVGITFKEKGRVYYFSSNNLKLKKDMMVIVETEKGSQYGQVVTDLINKEGHSFSTPLKRVIRIASNQDYDKHKNNLYDAKQALKKCREIVKKKKLKMQIMDATYTFDRDQLIFRFLADSRIDFRELAKELASIYKTRIELRQIGVRDKAKEVDGCGVCGHQFCCSRFLNDFAPVSINMAKNQNLALNPNNINGVCGRLLCCLNYENDCYQECQKGMPNVGKRVKTEKGEGKVISVNILERSYRVDIPEVGIIEEKMKNGC